MDESWSKHTRPKQDGQPGLIITLDPERRSFKQAMIAIVFYGMFIDALLFMNLVRHFGKESALKFDRKPHEDRLEALGIKDNRLLSKMIAFRESRRDLVHEKAFAIEDIGAQVIRTAQKEARVARDLAHELNARFAP